MNTVIRLFYYIKNNSKGHVVLRYLLYNCNNRIIKDQLALDSCSILSNLYLQFGCIPFEEMPYASSLINHNPTIYDLIDIVPIEGRNDELLAGYDITEEVDTDKLFEPDDEIEENDIIGSKKAPSNLETPGTIDKMSSLRK